MWSSWTSALARDVTEFAQVLSKDAAAAIGSATEALSSAYHPHDAAGGSVFAGDEDFTDPTLLRAVHPDEILALQADLTTYRVPLAPAEQAIYERWDHYPRTMEEERWKQLLTNSEEMQNAYAELVYGPAEAAEEAAAARRARDDENEEGEDAGDEPQAEGEPALRAAAASPSSFTTTTTTTAAAIGDGCTDSEFFGRYFWRLHRLRVDSANHQRTTRHHHHGADANSGSTRASAIMSSTTTPHQSNNNNNNKTRDILRRHSSSGGGGKEEEDSTLDGWDEVDALLHHQQNNKDAAAPAVTHHAVPPRHVDPTPSSSLPQEKKGTLVAAPHKNDADRKNAPTTELQQHNSNRTPQQQPLRLQLPFPLTWTKDQLRKERSHDEVAEMFLALQAAVLRYVERCDGEREQPREEGNVKEQVPSSPEQAASFSAAAHSSLAGPSSTSPLRLAQQQQATDGADAQPHSTATAGTTAAATGQQATTASPKRREEEEDEGNNKRKESTRELPRESPPKKHTTSFSDEDDDWTNLS